MRRFFTVLFIVFCFLVSSLRVAAHQRTQQTPAPQQTANQPNETKVKQQIEKLKLDAPVTIDLFDSRRFAGTIKSIEADRFLIADVDTKQLVEIQYNQVKKVRKGVGRIAPLTGKRVFPNPLITAAILAGIVVLIVVSVPKT